MFNFRSLPASFLFVPQVVWSPKLLMLLSFLGLPNVFGPPTTVTAVVGSQEPGTEQFNNSSIPAPTCHTLPSCTCVPGSRPTQTMPHVGKVNLPARPNPESSIILFKFFHGRLLLTLVTTYSTFNFSSLLLYFIHKNILFPHMPLPFHS